MGLDVKIRIIGGFTDDVLSRMKVPHYGCPQASFDYSPYSDLIDDIDLYPCDTVYHTIRGMEEVEKTIEPWDSDYQKVLRYIHYLEQGFHYVFTDNFLNDQNKYSLKGEKEYALICYGHASCYHDFCRRNRIRNFFVFEDQNPLDRDHVFCITILNGVPYLVETSRDAKSFIRGHFDRQVSPGFDAKSYFGYCNEIAGFSIADFGYIPTSFNAFVKRTMYPDRTLSLVSLPDRDFEFAQVGSYPIKGNETVNQMCEYFIYYPESRQAGILFSSYNYLSYLEDAYQKRVKKEKCSEDSQELDTIFSNQNVRRAFKEDRYLGIDGQRNPSLESTMVPKQVTIDRPSQAPLVLLEEASIYNQKGYAALTPLNGQVLERRLYSRKDYFNPSNQSLLKRMSDEEIGGIAREKGGYMDKNIFVRRKFDPRKPFYPPKGSKR